MRARSFHTLFLSVVLLACPALAAEDKVIRVQAPTPGSSNFVFDLIQEIVKRNGEYELVAIDSDQGNRVSVAKTVADFEAGVIDVMWTLSDRNWEEKYAAVRYPTYLGMFGLRLPIIKQERRNLFANVQDLADLRQFKAGQGSDWADTGILKANGIPVVPVAKYLSHFPMLEGGRFDYFPRAIHEPWSEVRNFPNLNLTVDEHIVLRYRVPFYMFVLKENRDLHRYLSEGMEELTSSGRHREMFFQLPEVQEALKKSNLSQRVMIELDNPNLTPETPVDREELWFDPTKDEIPAFES